jgi:hypothetical protein
MDLSVDRMKITILPDGTIKTETKSFVSKPNHDNAEQFLRAMAHLAGGETTREKIAKPGAVHQAETISGRTEVKA